jgi:excisionase family DNA binding protein
MATTYTVKQICDRFGVHEQTALTWIHNGELKAVNVGREPGKLKPRWRITEEALQEFEAKRTSTTTPAPVKRSRARKYNYL